MKRLIFIMGLFLSISAYSQENVLYEQDPVTERVSYTKFHEDGQVAETGSFNTSFKTDGKFISYDREGNILAIAYYKNGKKTGTWKHYHGKHIYIEIVYRDNKPIKVLEERTLAAITN